MTGTSRASPPRTALISTSEFLQSVRHSGYRSTSAAVAELVDNSVDAGATEVWIWVEAPDPLSSPTGIAVWDNGSGMTKRQLARALQFGGSSHYDSRSRLGRFGFGLPSSSLSQARHVEVFSWTAGRKPLLCGLNLDEMERRGETHIPAPIPRALPSHLQVPNAPSGTLVRWLQCDRLDAKRATTIQNRLRRDLGRWFRHQLWAGVQIVVDGQPVATRDPLFLRPDAEISGATPYGPPLTYSVRSDRGTEGVVKVQFALLPVNEWKDWSVKAKREAGILGSAGVSVVRSGREIAHGWYFLGDKRRQNYDDWWACELQFDQELDEQFGVSNSKQGVSPNEELVAALSPDLSRIAKELSAKVRQVFHESRTPPPDSPAITRAERNEWRLPRLNGTPRPRAGMREYLSYRLRLDHEGADALAFTWEFRKGVLEVSFNAQHPFYRLMIERGREEGPKWTQEGLEMLVLAFARAEAALAPEGELLDFRREWSKVVAMFLQQPLR